MAYTITKEYQGKGVHKKFTGFVTSGEFLASIYENHRDIDYDLLRYTINDFTEVSGHSVNEMDVKMAAAHSIGAAFSNPNINIAIVTTCPTIRQLVSGFAELTKYKLEYFTTLEDARKWIAETVL